MEPTNNTPNSTAGRTSGLLLNVLNYALLFSAFAAAYYLPMVMYGMDSSIEDGRVRRLLDTVFGTPAAQIVIAKNIAAHVLLLGLYFAFLIWFAERLSRAASVARWMTHFLTLVLGWTLLLSGNAVLFPYSSYTFSFPFLKNAGLATGLALLFVVSTFILLIRTRFLRLAQASALASAVFFLVKYSVPAVSGSTDPGGQNVIIIGVDSLSYAAYERLKTELPTLNHLLSTSTFYQRAYTPLGRTFPAWMSILSGKHPADHGAIFNLRNMENVETQDLISTKLQRKGYRTVYSIDERRFNNIDESFGFDHIVGPKAGALDFVMQQLNDTPLTNLLLQTRLSKPALSVSYTNTQSVPNYDADAFVQDTLDTTNDANQLFLAVHFESAHYPFHTRHAQQKFNTKNQFWNRYAAALTVVDAQIAQLIAGLKDRGYLDDALVVVLSDHGEALGESESELELEENPRELRGFGHGARVLSDHQNHIILGVTEFRNGKVVSTPATETRQVSLLDIRPLIENYIGTGEIKLQPSSECIVVETGLRLAEADDYRSLDPAQVAAGSARFYEIDSQGRMRLREDQLSELIKTKDVGWRCHDRVTLYSFANDKFLTVGLDNNGIATSLQEPPAEDIDKINEYRSHLIASLHKQQ